MPNKIVVINAFEPEDFFIRRLSQEYDNAVAENGMISELLFIGSMYFSFTPFPQKYDFEMLENDLQKSVEAIKEASTLAFFISFDPKKPINPAFSQFVSRLFHLDQGSINKEIWGEISAYNKKVRIVTVIDDEETWRKFKHTRQSAILPIDKINFKLFGFGAVYSSTFGFLHDNMLNDYGLKCLAKMHELGKKDSF